MPLVPDAPFPKTPGNPIMAKDWNDAVSEVIRLDNAKEVDGDGKPLNLVHRDINPANVFLSFSGRVKLGDFGVAEIAQNMVQKSRELAGKAGYFAPEQLAGADVDQRADVFSMGVMMFELLTGARLFEGETQEQIMDLNKRAKIPKPSSINAEIPQGVEEVMLAALEKKPKDRLQSARDMLHALHPFVPPPAGMSLAVAAIMRKVFSNELVQELQLREGLQGGSMGRGAGQIVGVCSGDERARLAFSELLISRGYRPEVCGDVESLTQLVTGKNPPASILLDVSGKGFSPLTAVGALAKAERPIPVVAVSEGLDAQVIRMSDAVGAVDILFKPFNIERVLTSVRAAIVGGAIIDSADVMQTETTLGVTPRVLLMSRDPSLMSRLTTELSDDGFEVEASPTIGEALERTDHASYHAVLYDAHPPSGADRLFAGQYRGRAAMGLVPIVYLTTEEGKAAFVNFTADRSAVRLRNEHASGLIEVLNQLWADNRLGRIFIRYPMVMPIEMRYGGRVFSGETIDLARGGVMLRCEQMPPIGTEVGISLKLPTSTPTIQVTGKVVRVDLPDGKGDKRAGIGVEFERFAGRAESAFIAYLAGLDPTNERRRTVILGAPPPKPR